jgi:flagellar basal-body rod modification protein FlgD
VEITPATTAAAKGAAKTETEDAVAPVTAANAVAGDFQTFLQLLTTQMRNQDPLKPLESTEFVSQLASFSGVEQQVRANDRLDRIIEVLSGGSAEGLAAWIGREVRAPAPAAFTGAPVEVQVTPVEDADKAVLLVKNDFDQVVAELPVATGATTLTWNGEDGQGGTAAHGNYRFELASYKGEELLDTQAGDIFTTVTEVRIEDGSPRLVVEGGGQVALDEVTAIR